MEPFFRDQRAEEMIREKSHDTTLNLQSMDPAPQDQAASPFRSHQLQARNHLPAAHHQEQPDWIFATLLAGFILVAWTVFFHFKRFNTVVSATFSKRHLSQLAREGNPLRERIAISLSALYILAFSLTIYQWNELYFGWKDPILNGFRLFVLIMLLLILFWTLKLFAMNFLSIIFRTHQSNHEYLLNIMLFSTLSGLINLPLLVLAIYLNSLTILFISLIIIILLFLIRFIKGMMIGAALTRFSYLFLFVYLCALELLPLVIILKLALIYNAH
jgi:hypothetical protein